VTAVEEAVAAAARGELIVIPTDTVYGIGARPDLPEATARVFEAKRRPRELELPVLVPSVAAAERVAEVDGRARRLMRELWPGPLTIVLARSGESGSWDLGAQAGTIGVRMPRHLLALAVLARTGPLAVTSANISGSPPARTCEELYELFGDAVGVYLCEEEALTGSPSTVVDLTHGEPRVLREGAVGESEIRAALSG
jgi:L-threonylcarbamoyladenylate synthase